MTHSSVDPAPAGSASGRSARDPDRWQRRALICGLLVVAGAAGVGLVRGAAFGPTPVPQVTGGVTEAQGGGAGDRGARRSTPPSYPATGLGVFVAARGGSPVRGTAGPLRRYRVVVERGAGQDTAAFAATVDAALGDPAGWTASGSLRVQRVPPATAADFVIYLATPVTSERMCAVGGLSTERYTSCRLPGQVIINLARWLEAVPDYGAPLAVYRSYVINHEVGHEFGEQHELCPGPGRPAPVMQQQTYGLQGCLANPWPYLDGLRYSGPPVA